MPDKPKRRPEEVSGKTAREIASLPAAVWSGPVRSTEIPRQRKRFRGSGGKIVRAETNYTAHPAAQGPAELALVHFWRPFRQGYALPERQMHPTRSLAAKINHGRWVVQCLDCLSAQVSSPSDPRFFCVQCHNAGSDLKWLPVIYPPNVDEIESELVGRPLVMRNWDSGQSVEWLRLEASLAAGGRVDPVSDLNFKPLPLDFDPRRQGMPPTIHDVQRGRP